MSLRYDDYPETWQSGEAQLDGISTGIKIVAWILTMLVLKERRDYAIFTG